MTDLIILIKGGGELASGVAHMLVCSHFRVCLTEIPHPRAVRRGVTFCEAVYFDSSRHHRKQKDGKIIQSDLGQLAGKAVRLRFVLKDADVYSFKFY